MTPAVKLAIKRKISHQLHEYRHDPASESYGTEAADKLGIEAARVFKTLVVSLDSRELVVGIVPVCSMLSLKQIAKVAGAKRATMADPLVVQRATGYVLGGVSPLGQKKRLKTVLDASALEYDSIFVSAGRRGLEIELAPGALLELTSGRTAKIAQPEKS
ncbi:Cys-tRNA(Pro) deacylase [Dongshaea marina]|uniref:Cys-tRNA(Pro) deacylase n=1 Tax=Dongshaea marina TaxID=2047966 RepID=UPI000D3E220E|nr:Cys-tRNA(Pro) deacylase [Dongshaea marina]